MNLARLKTTARKIIAAAMILAFALPGCGTDSKGYRTFADYPGFKEYYAGHCSAGEPIAFTSDADKELLRKYRPRLILPPGGQYPIDFYRDYLPNSLLRRYPGGAVVTEEVTLELLKANHGFHQAILNSRLVQSQAPRPSRPCADCDAGSAERSAGAAQGAHE